MPTRSSFFSPPSPLLRSVNGGAAAPLEADRQYSVGNDQVEPSVLIGQPGDVGPPDDRDLDALRRAAR